MKKKLIVLIGLILVLIGTASAQWKYNPFFWMGLYKDQTVGLATLASPSFTGTVKSAGPLELGPLGRSLKAWWNFEDFIHVGPSTTATGIWGIHYGGTGAIVADLPSTALRPGIWYLTTGTTTTGFASAHLLGYVQYAEFLFGGGVYTIEADIYIETPSTVTETYTLRFGFGDVAEGTDSIDGAYFEYSDTGTTPNWYRCTASNSTRTKTDTTVAAAAGAWTRLKVVVNAVGTSVEYFINGVSVGVVTTNIPTGAGRGTGAVYSILKSAGTTARLANIDWAWLHIDLSASR